MRCSREGGWRRGRGRHPREGRQAPRVHAHHEQREPAAQGDRDDRTGRVAKDRRRLPGASSSSGRCSSRTSSTPGKFDAVVLGWSTRRSTRIMFQIWHSSQTGPQQLNFTGYASPEVDRLIERDPPRVRPRAPGRARPRAPRRDRARPAVHVPLRARGRRRWSTGDRGDVERDAGRRRAHRAARGRRRPASSLLVQPLAQARRARRTSEAERDGAFLVRAVGQRLVLLVVISVLAHAVVHLAPGEPSAVDPMNPRIKPEDVARIREAFHLNEPLHLQYALLDARSRHRASSRPSRTASRCSRASGSAS